MSKIAFQDMLAVADETPLFAYTIPRRTGNDLRPGLLVRLLAATREGRSEDALADQTEIDDEVRETLRHGAIEGLKAGVADRMASRGVSHSRAVRPPLSLAAR